ncbi:hypothetical protein BGZ60DRAFT_561131 [Tricladium varicosporioides]|nr:hypothetical protein BGZ60DRAFT_561131 [Hymenoscyphus varicosporioides]
MSKAQQQPTPDTEADYEDLESPQDQQMAQYQQQPLSEQAQQHMTTAQRIAALPPRAEGYRTAAVRESRIKDRPYQKMNDSLKISIQLDLEVEVDLYARVKGDVTIGLM